MKSRCYNENLRSFRDYGTRGIKVCDEWKNSYESFRDWATSNGYQDGLSIERIDVNGNYTPDNCTFIKLEEQAVNKRNTLLTVFGVTKPKKVWARENNMTLPTLSSRLNKLGWSPERTVLTPVRSHK